MDTTHPKSTRVEDLRRWTRPARLPGDRRVAPVETTAWTVHATLMRYRAEKDGDVLLVIAGTSGATMFAEIPPVSCLPTLGRFTTAIGTVRRVFDARFRVGGQFRAARVSVLLTGIGFFSPDRRVSNGSPNGVEFHPVLALEFVTPPPVPVRTQTPGPVPTAHTGPTPVLPDATEPPILYPTDLPPKTPHPTY